MEKTKTQNLPIIGRVQHGEKINNKVEEYGYFIAKTQNDYMKPYIEKFNELFKGKQNIDIEFISENPLSIRYVRYNQSGEVCRSLENSNIASQKNKNGWQEIQCNLAECQYRQKNEVGKCACNRIGWLKFLIPTISTDRIFLMKITGQTSIKQLEAFINLQKLQDKSIKGAYTIFLYQKEQTNYLCQSFNNYVLDIVKKGDFISNNEIPQSNLEQENLSTNTTQNVNSEVVHNETQIKSQDKATNTSETMDSLNEIPKAKKHSKPKSKKNEEKPKDKSIENKEPSEKHAENQASSKENKDNSENLYIFDSLSSETITLNDGTPKEYSVGQFYDMKDQPHKIIVKPEFKEELENCELGTIVELLNIQEIGGRKFALNLKFIEKLQKNKVA